MHILTYITILSLKIIENALGTLRVIVISNGKKGIGALLNFVISLLWISSTGLVVLNIKDDPLKIIFFALGSYIGSYLGCYIEEKMAIGNNMLTAIIDDTKEKEITNKLRNSGFAVTITAGYGKEKRRSILFIMVPRKKRKIVVNLIRKIDNEAMIISEVATTICGGYEKEKP